MITQRLKAYRSRTRCVPVSLAGIDPRQDPADGGFQFGKAMTVDADLAESHATVPTGQLAGSVVLAGQRNPALAKLQGGPRRGAEQRLADTLSAGARINLEIGHLGRALIPQVDHQRA